MKLCAVAVLFISLAAGCSAGEEAAMPEIVDCPEAEADIRGGLLEPDGTPIPTQAWIPSEIVQPDGVLFCVFDIKAYPGVFDPIGFWCSRNGQTFQIVPSWEAPIAQMQADRCAGRLDAQQTPNGDVLPPLWECGDVSADYMAVTRQEGADATLEQASQLDSELYQDGESACSIMMLAYSPIIDSEILAGGVLCYNDITWALARPSTRTGDTEISECLDLLRSETGDPE